MKLLLALTAVVLSTCASAALASVSAPPYLGTWTARMSLDQMYDKGLDPHLAGAFRLVLRPNGTYTSFNSFDGASNGRFTASGKRIVVFDDKGCKTAGLDGKAQIGRASCRERVYVLV